MKRQLRRLLLIFLLLPTIAVTWLTMTESGLHWSYQRLAPYLPGTLTVAKLEGRLFGSITAKGINYKQDDATIAAEYLMLEWLPVALLTAKIDITRLHFKALKIVFSSPEQADQDQSIQLPDINMPWHMMLKNMQVDGLSIRQNEARFDLQQIRLSATTFLDQIDIDQLTVVADNFNINIEGKIKPTGNYRHKLKTDWQLALASDEILMGTGQLIGNTQKISLNQQLTGPLKLTFAAEINEVLEQFNWQASADVSKLDTARLNAGWPAVNGTATLNGKGDLHTASLVGNLTAEHVEFGPVNIDVRLQRLHNNSIQFDHIQLHSPINNTRIHSRGQWLPAKDGGNLAMALNWQNLRWPLKGNAWFNSSIGSGWIEGNAEQYQLGLASDRPWPQAPASAWYATAKGNLDGLNFDSIRITGLDGETNIKGELSWSPQLTWQAQLNTRNINPGNLWPEWPGQLDATIISNGQSKDGQLMAHTEITELTGKLRSYPISLRSSFNWHNNGLDIDYFDFHSGTSTLTVEGRVSEELGLDFTINSQALAELYPKTKGQLKADGKLTGNLSSPNIATTVKATELHLPGYEIARLDGTVAMDLFSWQQIDIKLAAESLSLNGYLLQSLAVDADTDHIKAKAVSESLTAQVELKGGISNKGWNGRIEQVDIKSPRFENWQLKQPAKLNISNTELLVDHLCLLSSQETSLCTSLKHQDKQWQFQLLSNQFPLKSLSPLLPPDLTLEGVASATADLAFQAPDQLIGHAQIDLPAGAISYPLMIGERDHWQYQSGKATITLDEQGLQATTELAINNSDRFNGQLTLPGAKLLALDQYSQPIQASVQLSIHDLGLFETMVPEIYDLQGEVEFNIGATGTLARPRINGQAHLLNGGLRIPRLGLNIEQIKFNSQNKGLETLAFDLNANSGDGSLTIQGQTSVDRHAGWPTAINIKGKEFEVSRTPEARVLITPDLQVKLQHRNIDIKGNIHIPYANLQPKDITTASRVSADAVIIDDEQTKVEKWAINSAVRLTLGERVNLYGFGFEGRLGGNLLLEDEPGQLTAATGEITIPKGRYRAYGQRLDVENGRLLYTGGPLSNPGLDLRAVRIANNVTAGLKIGGTLNQPQIDLFSIPAMGQTDTLAYLLLGRPIENTSDEEGAMMAKAVLALGLSGGDRLARTLGNRFGLDEMRVDSSDSGDQASLVMGRYLSPKLYVSYGVGLLESINTFNVRYQITDKLQLKGESGEHQGADFLYTIER